MLENAGVKVTEAIAVLDGVRRRLSELDHGMLVPLNAEMEQLWRNEDRIAVRLGRGASETQHYRRAIDRIDEALSREGSAAASPQARQVTVQDPVQVKQEPTRTVPSVQV